MSRRQGVDLLGKLYRALAGYEAKPTTKDADAIRAAALMLAGEAVDGTAIAALNGALAGYASTPWRPSAFAEVRSASLALAGGEAATDRKTSAKDLTCRFCGSYIGERSRSPLRCQGCGAVRRRGAPFFTGVIHDAYDSDPFGYGAEVDEYDPGAHSYDPDRPDDDCESITEILGDPDDAYGYFYDDDYDGDY